MAAELYGLCVDEMAHEWTGPLTRGWNVKSDDRSLQTLYQIINMYLYLFFYNVVQWLEADENADHLNVS